ncbi:ceramidase domain-containing protein [Pontivivens ytuae]|uniref:Ceramidase domain-containing protein n=1 Tax=Pontivivens ytuae TaxID=2789856 RepID=A0A7S9QDV9_9RHOB|nr:ceramidase domain-containing protein [Pontivivens ytuae]QPH54561.1 ceramidase domain-containing protein [Pontivivens ytuae]
MDGLTQQFDGYCERTDFTFWSEPLNAVTNAAFLIAALLVWRLARREGRMEWGIATLMIILTAIGIGSFLFHTFATAWAAAADVFPIMLYILVYLWLATVRMLNLPWWAGLVAVVLFFPYSAAVATAVETASGGLNGSEGYVPTLLLIAAYGLFLLGRKPETGRGLLIGSGILALSLTARTVDEALCDVFPIGTHIFWHILNGVMLGWMIVVMMRHDAAYPPDDPDPAEDAARRQAA